MKLQFKGLFTILCVCVCVWILRGFDCLKDDPAFIHIEGKAEI